MERPGRLGAVIVVAVSLAALSVYLLTRPSVVPPPDQAVEAPLVALLRRMLGSPSLDAGTRHVVAAVLGAANAGLRRNSGTAPAWTRQRFCSCSWAGYTVTA